MSRHETIGRQAAGAREAPAALPRSGAAGSLVPMERWRWGKKVEPFIEVTILLSGIVSAAVVAAIFGFLACFTVPAIASGQFPELLSWNWRPVAGQYGTIPMAVGSLCLATSATLTAFPLGVGICSFIHSLGPRSIARPVRGVVQFMTSIPTVVYGFVSVFLLVPLLRQVFQQGTGFSWLAASATLTLLVLPTIVLIVDAQLRQLGPDMELSAAALGMSPVQTLIWVVLPQASRGLVAAAVLGFGRALGDTIISLMLSGNAPQLPHSMLDSIRTLTAHIALVVATDIHSPAYHSLFVSGLILVTISAMVNVAIRWIVGRSDGN